MIDDLSKAQVYNVFDDLLYKQLLRLNVEEYNKLNGGDGVKFDFSIWANKSLEHILPKSYFYHVETSEDGQSKYIRGDGEVISEEIAISRISRIQQKCLLTQSAFSEHCIGNLVLLYGKNNSEIW